MVIDVTNRHRLLRILGDPTTGTALRSEAASALAESDELDVIDALIALAKDSSTPVEVQSASGRSLAQICFRRRRDLEEIISAFMTEASDEAYDTEMGLLLRAHPEVTLARGIVGSGR